MFRKPRSSEENTVVVGRAPTPPLTPAKTPFSLAITPSVPAPRMAKTNVKSRRPAPMPVLGRQVGTAKTSTPVKGNSSILSFFKKSDDGENGSLFVHDKHEMLRGNGDDVHDLELGTDTVGLGTTDDETRFNEVGGASKRRKLSLTLDENETPRVESNTSEVTTGASRAALRCARRSGPFIDESDSEQDEEDAKAVIGVACGAENGIVAGRMPDQTVLGIEEAGSRPDQRPQLLKEETSVGDLDGFKDFDDMDDFDEDLFEEGDEFLEKRYMEEQAQLEEQELAEISDVTIDGDQSEIPSGGDSGTAACPICNMSLGRATEQDAGVHVNNCLDGNPTPLPLLLKSDPQSLPRRENPASVDQYRRPVRPAKPGQANPFTLGEADTSGGSAFNKLMSGHAEDAAWAEAAAAENASRGKPSYQRTCPFYKILPGLFICVDAFRYGAVAGCKAYFLSHFHSDHYVGLTASWTHGPIYCSKVTANLVRQQLRVDPQYVVALEFEQTVEVPGTKGVSVSMISANHCPGSSLFLFEKTIGKKFNGEPRLQRILHCGDFRACKMHIEHPLLMPAVRDKVTGKSREQQIDVCYLDTTYLNPKYAFPSQQAVIQACADMCVCLSKDSPDETDGWETMKRQRAGEGMVKFIQRKDSEPEIKSEPTEEDNDVRLEPNPHASQQILSSVNASRSRGRLLVVVGTYSIGKERICLGIARALNSKIYAPPSKQRIVAALEDPELDARMTSNPQEAQVHMTPLFEIRAETLDDYLRDFFPHFTRAVGFRPSGWNYKPPNTRFLESPSVQTVLHGDNWKSTYSMRDLVPQRGSSKRASCFGVPYSEHSSFRELSMFCCALRIDRIIPTVNVGSKKGRERMKGWCDKWAAERKKNGLFAGWV